MVINSNNNTKFEGFDALSILKQNRTARQKEVQRTSTTALNINDAIDSVSAYTIAESLRIRTRVLGQANENIQNDTALLKTAQDRGNSIVDSIKEIQRLAVSATDESITDDDRRVIQRDINRLVTQISEDSQITFNGRNLIDGSATTGNQAIATVLSNSSLYSGTTANTALTALKNSNGVSLGIDANDRVTASYVKDGNIYTTSFSVDNNTLEDIFKNLNTINGMSLTDTPFIGGGRGMLEEPTIRPEPVKPIDPEDIKPTEPTEERPVTVVTRPAPVNAPAEEISMPAIPSESEFFPESEPVKPIRPNISEPDIETAQSAEEYVAAMTAYENTMANYAADMEQYEIKKTAYDAIQAGTAEVIDSTDPQYNDAVANYSEQMARYVQYRKEKEAYDQYQTDLEKYNQYERTKTAWDNYDRDYSDYLTYKDEYETELLPNYDVDMENYRAEYAQYLKDKADYDLMTADIVKSDSEGLHVTARKPGLEGQISGVSINIADSSGNAKLTVNATLNNFKTTTFAEDAREDNSIYFQIGDTVGQAINFGFNDMRAEAFGLKGKNGNIISISTKSDADAALTVIDNALNKAVEHLQTIGSSEKRLGYIGESLAIEINNIQEPDSLVRNAGMAKQLTVYSTDLFRRNINQSMLAIANQHSSSVLALLR